jgi:outer membrane lipoprotein LolB
MRKCFFINIILVLTFLSGCVAIKPQECQLHFLTWQNRMQQLNSITKWHITGSISLIAHNKSAIINFDWQQNTSDYVIYFYGPFNLNGAKIIGNSKKVIMQKNLREQITATTPEALIYQQLGLKLPITDLIYWIRGLPAPSIIAQQHLDTYNHLYTIEQNDWQILYKAYNVVNNTIDVPKNIELIRLATNPIKIKIAIKSWKLRN